MRFGNEFKPQRIPIPLTPEQKALSNRLKEIYLPKPNTLITQIDYSSIELRVAAMCDPIYALRRLQKQREAREKKKKKCKCSEQSLLRHGCKCGGK